MKKYNIRMTCNDSVFDMECSIKADTEAIAIQEAVSEFLENMGFDYEVQ